MIPLMMPFPAHGTTRSGDTLQNASLARSPWGGKIPYVTYLFLSLVLYWLHYPPGTYELSGDLWLVGNFLSYFLNSYDFSGDYWMTHGHVFFKAYLPLLIIHVPGYFLFHDWERYIFALNGLSFFLGCSLLYIVLYRITRSKTVSFFSSLLFSCATVWFVSGDILALVPIYATLNRTLAYLLVLVLLMIFAVFPLSGKTVIWLSLICALMVWAHPTTFVGPGISIFIGAYILYFWRASETVRKRLLAGIVSGIVISISIGFYAYIPSFLVNTPSHALKKEEMLSAAEVQKYLEQHSGYELGHGDEYNPMRLTGLKKDLVEIPGYKVLLLFALTLVAMSLFYRKDMEYTRYIALFALICFALNLGIRELEYIFLTKGKVASFGTLERNDKWIYFFCYLTAVSVYPKLRQSASRLSARKGALIAINILFLAMLGSLLKYEVLQTGWRGPFGAKAAEKTGLSLNSGMESETRLFSGLPRDGEKTSITKINRDVRDVTSFMAGLPGNLTFAGPAWLRYKARRNVAWNIEDGFYYLRFRDRRYVTWKEREEIYLDLINNRIPMKNKQRGLFCNGSDWSGAKGVNPANGWEAGDYAGNYDAVSSREPKPFNVCLRVQHNGKSNFPYMASTAIPTEIGKTYRFSFYFKKGTAGEGLVGLGTTWGNHEYKVWRNLKNPAWTQYSHVFTAQAGETYVYLQCNADAESRYDLFDEVLLEMVSSDTHGNSSIQKDTPGKFELGTLRRMEADFILVEKFKSVFDYDKKQHFFLKRDYDFSGWPVVYENDSFVVIDLRDKKEKTV